MRSRATDLPAMPVEIDAYLQAILDSVAQPVWVVDHDGFVVLRQSGRRSRRSATRLSELAGRNGHEPSTTCIRDGSPYPAEDCPVTQRPRRASRCTCDEDWFVRRDGSMFPVAYTVVADRYCPTGRGMVIAFNDMTCSGRPSRRCASARRSSPTVAPARLGDRCTRALPLRQPGRAGRGRLRRLLRAGGPAGPRDGPLQVPRRRRRSPRRTARSPTRARRARDAARAEDWLVRKDGSILRITYSPAPFDLPDGPGSVTAFTDIEAQSAGRAGGPRARRRAGACGRAQAARRRIIEAADAARAQLDRDLHDGAQQQFVSALLTAAAGASAGPRRTRRRRWAARDGARAGRTGIDGAAPPGRRDPPGDPHRPRPRPRGGVARLAAPARRVGGTTPRRAAADARGGEPLLLRLRGAHQRRQARRGRRTPGSRSASNGDA